MIQEQYYLNILGHIARIKLLQECPKPYDLAEEKCDYSVT